MPNPALDKDMDRYKEKIERKFKESYVNHTFKFPRVEPQNSDALLVELTDM